jgi:NADPH:quinone reductase-like Zn-dependent oxidoreductase
LTDGAREVISVGENVDEFKVGDNVVGTFWPYWLGGEMTPATKRDIPGDSIDGYAREYVCMPAHAFTKVPAGYTHVEATTLPCAGVTAWRGLVVCGQLKLGDTVLILGTGGVSLFALQFARAAGARFAGELVIPALFSNQIRTSGISIGSRTDQEDMIRAITANRIRLVP